MSRINKRMKKIFDIKEYRAWIRLKSVKTKIQDEYEVKIKVKAVGICGSDISRYAKLGSYVLGMVWGHEFSGEVVEIGAISLHKILCPSMMCAKYNHLEQEVHALEEAGIDIFHIDIMDGSFVPNFGMGLQDAELICNLAQKEVDVHLMIQEPGRYIKKFADMGASIIFIHPESDRQPVRTLQTVQNFGMKAGIAVSPEVTIEAIRPRR